MVNLAQTSMMPSSLSTNMNGCMFGFREYPKIAWGIIKRVFVYVVDVFRGEKFAFQKPLHHKPVFWFIMSNQLGECNG